MKISYWLVLLIGISLVFSPEALSSLGSQHELATDAFTILGEEPGDEVGFSVAMLPDVNGGGIADLLVSSPFAHGTGQVYLIYGEAGFGASGFLDLSLLNGGGVIITGEAQGDQLGWCVAYAGDLNSDGKSDFLISAPGHDPVYGTPRTEAGRCYLIYGRDDFGQTFDLSTFGPTDGIIIDGPVPYSMIGISLSAAGDSAFLIGAPYQDVAGKIAAGVGYLVKYNGSIPDQLDLLTLGSQGKVFTGSNNFENAGYSLSGGFDFNDDGISDILIGVPGAYYGHPWYETPGRAYLVLGGSGVGDLVDLSTLTGSQAAIFDGDFVQEQAGSAVLGVSDFNQDGIDDVAISAPLASPNGIESAGRVYVVFGSSPPYTPLDLGDLGPAGITFNGNTSGAGDFGLTLSQIGDMSEDGKPDIAIGAVGALGNGQYYAGKVHVLIGNRFYKESEKLGAASLVKKETPLLGGKYGDLTGCSVAGGWDVNGDGRPDMIIGARGHSTPWESKVGRALFLPGEPGFGGWDENPPSTGVGTLGDNMAFTPILEAWGDFTPGSSEGFAMATIIDPSWSAATGPIYFGIYLMNRGIYPAGGLYANELLVWPLVAPTPVISLFYINPDSGFGFRNLSIPAMVQPGKDFYIQILFENPDQVTYPGDLAGTNCLQIRSGQP